MSQFNLRHLPRVNYYEHEEPSFDANIFCSQCREYVYEFCSIHGPLLVIPDNTVPIKTNFPSFIPRAALTIPNGFLHLARSTIPGAGLGVFTSLPLPTGVRFGPYRGQIAQTVNSVYCWQISKHDRPAHVVDAADENRSNWMRYVNCSRHWQEQNLLAYQYKGQIYYRTIKNIPRFTELLVFYGSKVACLLNINLRVYNSDKQSFEILAPSYNMLETNYHGNKKNIQNDVKEGIDQNIDKYRFTAIDETESEKVDDSEDLNSASKADKTQIQITNTDNGSEFFYKVEETGQNTNVKIIECDCDTNIFKLNTYTEINTRKQHQTGPHCCEYCDKYFTSIKKLRVHKTNVHSKYKLRCPHCLFTSSNSFFFDRHMAKHNKDNIYKCEICPYATYTKSYLNRHQRVVHKIVIDVIHCNHCGYKTTDNLKYMHHVSTHAVFKRLERHVCQYVTESARMHMEVSHYPQN